MQNGRCPIRVTQRVLRLIRHFGRLVYRDSRAARRETALMRIRARQSDRPFRHHEVPRFAL
ncbi:MAG: hypothetical protein V1778_00795 [bacterium]